MRRVEKYLEGLKRKLPEALKKPRVREEEKVWKHPPRPDSLSTDIEKDEKEKSEKNILPFSDLDDIKLEDEPSPRDLPIYKPIGKEVEKIGTDALGWYKPFHYNKQWGIFIRVEGIKFLLNLFRKWSDANPNKLFKTALKLIYYHEYFHFLTEVTSTFLEYDFLNNIKHRFLEEKHQLGVKPLYRKYVEVVMREGTEISKEEGLANSFSLDKLKWPGNVHAKKFIEKFQPSPYRDLSLDDSAKISKIRKLGQLLDFPDLTYLVALKINEEIDKMYECLFLREFQIPAADRAPIHLVFEAPLDPLVLRFEKEISGIVLASWVGDREHAPPHIHVNEKRYWWPSLKPFKHNKEITPREIKSIAKKRNEIERNIEKSIIWAKRYPSKKELEDKYNWPEDHPTHPLLEKYS